MTLEELLSNETSGLECMEQYFKTVGLNYINEKTWIKLF